MANPEHVKIVKAGREALEKWWGGPWKKKARGLLEPPTQKVLDLQDANLEGLVLSDLCLRGANLRGAGLLNVNLSASDLTGANLSESGLLQAYLEGTNLSCAVLEKSNLSRSDLTGAILYRANLRGAGLSGTRLIFADMREADLTGADISMAQFAEADLEKAKLDGVLIYNTGTEGWSIKDVHCTHFNTESDGILTRIPKEGDLAPGEFEDRFKSRPTIELLFEYGMNVLDPVVLSAAIDDANSKHSEAALRLLSIDARGGIPRAVIEIAEKIPKNDALTLVRACYQDKLSQMQREIETLRQDKQTLLTFSAQGRLLTALKADPVRKSKNRPTQADMQNRNKAVAMAAAKFKAEHDRLPTVDEIIAETQYTRQQIYSTDSYKEGKIAKSSSTTATEMTGSVHESQQFSETSELHSRAIKRSKSDQDELDALIDQQEKEKADDETMQKLLH